MGDLNSDLNWDIISNNQYIYFKDNDKGALFCGDCADIMKEFPDECIDTIITSPPYDNLRKYQGYNFNFEDIAQELCRVIKIGGIIVWIVADATIKGSETGTSFKQALYFKDICRLNLFDTMIWDKQNCSSIGSMNRYENVFEYMFVLSKGQPKTANIIKDRKNKRAGELQHGSIRQQDGEVRKTTGYGKRAIAKHGRRHNVWRITPAKSNKERLHPAPFSKQLINDHVISWSNPGDIILDPMCGGGTTCEIAKLNDRKYIGIDISLEYIRDICIPRLK